MTAPFTTEQFESVYYALLFHENPVEADTAKEWATRNLSIPRPANLDWPEFITHCRNYAGVWETILQCPGSCGKVYGIIPALHPHNTYDPACGRPECDSYDINRDVMTLLALGEIDGIHKEEDKP